VLAAYLVDQKQTEDLDLIVNDIAHELYAQSGHLAVSVTSARKLTNNVRAELITMLRTGTSAKHVELSEHIDPTLLGGLVARTPNAILDVSVRSQIKQLSTI